MQHTLLDLKQITAFRHELHQNPELSGQEVKTADRVVAFLERYKPAEVIRHLGGTGVAAVFKGTEVGPTVLFRAELDALPIQEVSSLPHKSTIDGTAHLCGHDGHMAILMGVASLLSHSGLPKGNVILLFQPAEETGQGAFDVLKDERFAKLKPDYVFALHNLPGYPKHQIVTRNQTFAAASTGMIVELYGKASHAAEPENGLNPGEAMAEIILAFHDCIRNKEQFQNLTLLTVIHARLGDIAFGTNPGYATVMATLRSYHQADLDLLKQLTGKLVDDIATKYSLTYEIRFTEEFPATVNRVSEVNTIKTAAQKLELDTIDAVHPFKWSEDFGHFTNIYKGALFGLGSGLEQAQLHHTHYDFPDEIIPTGANMFYTIASEILNK